MKKYLPLIFITGGVLLGWWLLARGQRAAAKAREEREKELDAVTTTGPLTSGEIDYRPPAETI